MGVGISKTKVILFVRERSLDLIFNITIYKKCIIKVEKNNTKCRRAIYRVTCTTQQTTSSTLGKKKNLNKLLLFGIGFLCTKLSSNDLNN